MLLPTPHFHPRSVSDPPPKAGLGSFAPPPPLGLRTRAESCWLHRGRALPYRVEIARRQGCFFLFFISFFLFFSFRQAPARMGGGAPPPTVVAAASFFFVVFALSTMHLIFPSVCLSVRPFVSTSVRRFGCPSVSMSARREEDRKRRQTNKQNAPPTAPAPPPPLPLFLLPLLASHAPAGPT